MWYSGNDITEMTCEDVPTVAAVPIANPLPVLTATSFEDAVQPLAEIADQLQDDFELAAELADDLEEDLMVARADSVFRAVCLAEAEDDAAELREECEKAEEALAELSLEYIQKEAEVEGLQEDVDELILIKEEQQAALMDLHQAHQALSEEADEQCAPRRWLRAMPALPLRQHHLASVLLAR